HPELIKFLSPADSPMAHTVKMIKTYYPQYASCKVASISPCYAKRHEFDENGLGDYVVTMRSLSEYFDRNGIDLASFQPSDYDNPLAERGVLYSTPGGLLRTAERFVPGISKKTRKIEGFPHVYEYLEDLAKDVKSGKKPVYQLVDCLNCGKGCNCGAGTVNQKLPLDELENYIESRKDERLAKWHMDKKHNQSVAQKKLDATIDKYWEEGLYNRSYEDRSDIAREKIKIPTEEEIKEIFIKLGKKSEKDILNCQACGYKTCRQMAIAIYNGKNQYSHCHYFVKHKMTEDFKAELNTKVRDVLNKSLNCIDLSKNNVNGLVSVTEEMSKSVQDSSSAIEQMIGNVKSINGILSENFKIVTELEAATEKGTSGLVEVSGLVNEIEEKSKNLVAMSKTIDQIAQQTNLLSMNAAIEAAHAGNSGKGFAVVAAEIRKLAENSSKEANSIDDVLKKIKSLIDTISEKSKVVAQEFDLIVNLSKTVKLKEDLVHSAADEQDKGGSQLLESIAEMKEIQNAVESATSQLEIEMEEMRQTMQNFQV
ncbi:MAG: chemotaxis protein, partial [Treponemataceae bacterium]|nr:chemotaxis protein [Treponemataceae bacterium]